MTKQKICAWCQGDVQKYEGGKEYCENCGATPEQAAQAVREVSQNGAHDLGKPRGRR